MDVLPGARGRHGVPQQSRCRPPALGLDQALIWVVIGLLAWGLVMVYSASIAMPDNPRFGKIEPYHFAAAPCDGAGRGLCGGVAGLSGADGRPGSSWRPRMFLLALVLLVMVLVPGVGLVVNGCAALAAAGRDEFPALRAGQVCRAGCTPPTTWCAAWR